MRDLAPSLPPGQPDPELVRGLLIFQRVCLVLVGLIATSALAVWIFNPQGAPLPAIAMHLSIPMEVTTLICTLGLALSEPGLPRPILRLSRLLDTLAVVVASAVLVDRIFHLSQAANAFLGLGQTSSTPGNLPLHPPAAFIFLAVVMILIQETGPFFKRAADLSVSCLCLLAMILVSESLFGAWHLFGVSNTGPIPAHTLASLVLLTIVVTLRHAPSGMFSIFLGRGIGSRIARGFAPILLLLPFLWELGRETVFAQMIPPQYATSALISLVAALSIVLLIFLVWQINDMEQEIHDLTIRDDLTGLYNMRGFNLLAEQTLRLAQRAQLPFSVLFIDLDNLKQINDKMGHSAGSAYLAETGEILDASFRAGDVKGRFGGDEFVVAGQFSVVGIEIAAHRLAEAAAQRNASDGRRLPLSFSIGYVTCEYYSEETLKELVVKADEKMYQDKRRKKMQAAK
jgi:diguanylate cyclase (GGDEF)-like protein